MLLWRHNAYAGLWVVFSGFSSSAEWLYMPVDLTILILCSIAISALGTLIFLQDPKKPNNKRYAFLSVAIVAWSVFNFLSDYATVNVLLFTQLTFFAGSVTIAAVSDFIVHFPNKLPLSSSVLIKVQRLLGILILPTIFTPLFISGVHITDEHGSIEVGILYGIFLFYVLCSLLIIVPLGIIHQYKHATSLLQKHQVLTISIGIILYGVLSIASSVVLPLIINDWTSSRFGPAYALILAVSVAYAIVRHGLFDIKLAAVRSLVYLCILLTLSGTYYLFAYLLSTLFFGGHITDLISVSPVNMVLALLLAFLFQPIKRFFDRVTDNIFFRNSYKSEDFFTDFGQLLTSTTDLRGLLERASSQMATTFKSEQVFFHLHYVNNVEHYMSAGTHRHARLPMYDTRLLDDYSATDSNKIILTDFVEDKKVRRMLRSHKVALVSPLRHGDQTIGYVMLGEHLSGYYTKRDLAVLSSIGNELIIAIQNAISLHEVKELNATLQQRIDVATKELRSSNAQLKHLDEVKDEFMSMASHQLRTPLTSIKGYLSMVLDGDIGKITPQQEKVLAEAFNSSERMVHLIADFLNVSRLQTGKFVIEKSVIDFNALVEHEINDLQVMAKGRSLELVLKLPKAKLLINADAGKLREVITNFVDNAIYYSRVGTKIAIRVKQDGDALLFTVTDTGIGVPKSEQSKVFGKFFRATNARKQRPDGTGVGLYLARKVITAHGGKEIFESVENKGSIFGFRLPLAVLPNNADDANEYHNDR